MKYTMYDSMRHLPLFQGMGQAELSVILDKVRMHFLKFTDKEIILRQGDVCDKLVFLIKGQMTIQTISPCGTFSMEETIESPAVIELHSLFGKCPAYKATYRACGETALLTIEKQYIYSILSNYEIVRMNLFNQLSNIANLQYEQRWGFIPQDLEGQLIYFIRSLCTIPHGRKILRIRRDDLASFFGTTRPDISRILNRWQSERLVESRREEYIFPELERLGSNS